MDNGPLTRDEVLDFVFDALNDGLLRANEGRTVDANALNSLAITALTLAQYLPGAPFEHNHDDAPIPREWN